MESRQTIWALSKTIDNNLRKSGYMPEAEQYHECLSLELNKAPLEQRFLGTYTPKFLLQSVRNACVQAAAWAKERDREPLVIWNPTTEAMFIEHEKALTVLSKCSATKQVQHDVSKRSDITVKHPVAKTQKSGASQKRTVPPSPDIASTPPDVKHISQQLRDWANNNIPYSVRHAHIKCNDKACRFCYQMFHSIALTNCQSRNHADCHPCGWFPHVGEAYWKYLQKSHARGIEYKHREHVLKPGELPPLRTMDIRSPQSSPSKRPLSPEEKQPPPSPSYQPMSPNYTPTLPKTLDDDGTWTELMEREQLERSLATESSSEQKQGAISMDQ